jgi:phosphoglycerol transferase MdoB-like AlkP superfamily enzyme
LGTQTAVDTSDVRWLTPLPLWTGILAGPIAWALDLMASYAVVKWVCHTQRYAVLPLITIASLVVVIAAAAISWTALMRTASDTPTDGGRPRQRARFMAVLGLASCALFALQIIAGAIPHWVLDACQ